jgi:plasmid replication initiation protein
LVESVVDNGAQELKLFEHEGGPLIQVEVNLEEAPLFASNRRNRTDRNIEARSIVVTREGHRLEQYWKVTASPDFGLPGPLDQDVFVAVMRLASRIGGIPVHGKVHFSVYELIELMNRTHAGSNYEDVRDSLDRLAAISIYAENAFYSKEDEDFKSLRFHLWEVAFRKRRRKGRASEQHTLKFSEVLARSYNASYLKSLDAEFYYSLQKDLAKSLYKLVDVKRKNELSWTVELDQLRQLIVMPPSYKHPSTIKRQLEPAHRELVKKGYLTGVEVEERGKGRAKKHIVRYRVSQKFVREHATAALELSERERFAVDILLRSGMWVETANELVCKHGAGHCLHYVEALSHQENVKNPAGWLKRYIENGWPVQIPDEHGLSLEGEAPSEPSNLQRRHTQEAVRRRSAAGEFDEIARAFENLPYEEYKKYVGSSIPIVDGDDNRYYVSLEGDLFLYVGNTDEQNRYHICTLRRAGGSE